MKNILPFLFISLLLFTGCKSDKVSSVNARENPVKGHSVDEITRVKDTVLLYDALLADGYRAQNMNALAQVATEQRAQKAYYHMAALGEGSVKMDSNLNKIIFTDIKIISPDNAEAATEEEWDYKYINYKSGLQVYDNSVAYVLRYHLIKISAKWLVDDITVVSSKEENSRKYEPVTGKSGK